jgi:hypothetical protein
MKARYLKNKNIWEVGRRRMVAIGSIAQLAEHLSCQKEDMGSIPGRSLLLLLMTG